MQNVFKSGQLYDDKKDVKTPEEIEAEAEERKIIEERIEEAEYLETLSHFHWVVYPWFKLLEKACDKIFGCKKQLDKENALRRQEVNERQARRQAKRMKERDEHMAQYEAAQDTQDTKEDSKKD